jgi:hypothetical protein
MLCRDMGVGGLGMSELRRVRHGGSKYSDSPSA